MYEGAKSAIDAMTLVRRFCMDEQRFSYFLVNFRDKEERQNEYRVLADLTDLRLLHWSTRVFQTPKRRELGMKSSCWTSAGSLVNGSSGAFTCSISRGLYGSKEHRQEGLDSRW